ncbi:murein hydrolase activator EnvC family protein [Paenibacillus nasutitermitis]|uniref:Peptidase M23 n=1 Tax=Paenibacillus nasutitermitis TaxID=1652958 RepID=A0A916ZEA2_9BACL|nr:M23 family metallopeptidase [Paenibacillus nasutitermitis]GGD92044.1 peptidase M23 [Paenibacillus nasutitermitis]
MKKGLALLAAVVFAVYIFQPFGGEAASQVDKINKELERVRREMNAASQNRKKADHDKAFALAMKDETAKTVNEIIAQINNVGNQMNGVQSQIDAAEEKLMKAGEELQETEERIKSRDKLLQSRIRLMYTDGVVSYLDVLMSSTDFSDFIDRFDSLKSILGQDQEILDGHKKDKELIAMQKLEIEKSLADVKVMYAKLDSYHDLLKNKESQKEVMILKYKDQAEESEEISAEQEALLIELAKKVSELEKKKKSLKTYYTGGKLGMPLRDAYRLSSPFGYRTHPIYGTKRLHAGMDMAVSSGTPIYAAESGVVLVAQWWSGYGNCVIIDHGGGLWTVYGHIRNGGIKVKKGETVKRGQKIAEVGSTGDSTGNHLHFEVRKKEVPVNPASYLK